MLAGLEARWREQGAFVSRVLRPGLSGDEMDRITAPIGLQLPREARLWWGWHDGAGDQIPGVAAELGPGRAFLPLTAAVAEHRKWNRLHREVLARTGRDPDWKASWLPIDASKSPVLFDCAVDFDAAVPVRSFFVEDPRAGEQGVSSIGELVRIWIAAIDCGAWRYDRQKDCWHYDWTRLDPDVELLNLA